MTTLGNPRTDLYRIATQQITPVAAPRRLTCSVCRDHKSIGQFPRGSDVCITCKPQGANFRRGEL
jgi:hypothetical protein